MSCHVTCHLATTISMGGRAVSVSARLSSPLYLASQGLRGLSISLQTRCSNFTKHCLKLYYLVFSHSVSCMSLVMGPLVTRLTPRLMAAPAVMATMFPTSIGTSSPVFLNINQHSNRGH